MHARRGFRTVSTARTIVAVLGCTLMFAGSCQKTSTAPTPTPGPARGTLRVGYAADDYSNEGRRNIGVTPLNTNVVETLVRLTPGLTLEPLLAQSWEFIAPNTWRFKIRPGVTFHDGKPLNAAAVKSGLFDRTAAAGGGQIRAGENSAKVVDDMTVDFTSTVTNLRVPEMLAHPGTGVYSPGTDPATPVGTGPFKFVSYEKGKQIVVERYADYWGDKARSERIEFLFFPTSDARLAALKAGKVDVVFPLASNKDEEARKAGYRLATSSVAGANVALFAAAGGLPPHDLLSDAEVRKAIAMSIDRKGLVAELGRDAVESQTYVPREMLGPHAATVKGFPNDKKRARETLDAAGWKLGPDGIRQKGGRDLRITVMTGYPSADINDPVPTFVKGQLKAVGIDATTVAAESLGLYNEALRRSDGDLYVEQGTQTDGNPAFLPLLIYTWDAAGTYNKLFGAGQAFDTALTRALTTPDADQARQATAEAVHEAVDVHASIIPLVGLKRVYAYAPGVTGLIPHPSAFCVRWDQAAYTGK
jgi:peptide/nickel transport system substrate-binding protein